MGKKQEVQQRVRQRARFTCDICKSKIADLKQYAHIVPESDGGLYSVDNLLWACESCQRKYEPAKKPDDLKAILIKKMTSFRDKSKTDSVASDVFELIDSGESVRICMGSMNFIDVRKPFSEISPYTAAQPQFIELFSLQGELILNGLIKDEYGKPLIKFIESKLEFYTGDAWDFERSPGYLKITNKSKKTWLSIKQNQDRTLVIDGKLYFDHKEMTINAAVNHYAGLSMKNVTMQNGLIGLSLPFTEWIPVGHVRCKDWN
jgi:hypothetical protein